MIAVVLYQEGEHTQRGLGRERELGGNRGIEFLGRDLLEPFLQYLVHLAPGLVDLLEGGPLADLVDTLPAAGVALQRIGALGTQGLEQIKARLDQMGGDVGRAVAVLGRTQPGLCVAQALEAVAEELGVHAQGFGEWCDTRVHGLCSG